jgi:hypothetical protein
MNEYAKAIYLDPAQAERERKQADRERAQAMRAAARAADLLADLLAPSVDTEDTQ